jgi:hypothetical protein
LLCEGEAVTALAAAFVGRSFPNPAANALVFREEVERWEGRGDNSRRRGVGGVGDTLRPADNY